MAEKAPGGFLLLLSFDPGASSAESTAAYPMALAAGTMALAAAIPSRATLTHPDVSELFPAKWPDSSSRKTTRILCRLDLLTLFSDHHSPMAMPDARQCSMRPTHMLRLAAAPLTDITRPPRSETLALNMNQMIASVKMCYL